MMVGLELKVEVMIVKWLNWIRRKCNSQRIVWGMNGSDLTGVMPPVLSTWKWRMELHHHLEAEIREGDDEAPTSTPSS